MIRAALVCVALVANTTSLAAQAISVLAGGVQARYADSISGTAGFLSARLGGSSAGTAGALETTFSQFVTGEWVTQLGAYGTAVVPLSRELAAGVVGSGEVNNFEGGTWSGRGALGPLVAVRAGSLLATLGASVGGVRRLDESSLGLGTANAKLAYAFRGGLSLEGWVIGTTADTLRYVDATLGLALREPTVHLSLSGGARAGDLSDDPWGQARIEYAISPGTTFEGAVGRYPRDLTGFTDGLFVSVGLRLHLTRASRAPWSGRPRVPLSVRRMGGGRARISITYETKADRLEIAGEWNGWTPVPLVRDVSNRWSIELRIQPGVYKFALLVDGTTWTVPEGVASVPDDFGGRVALLILR